MRTRLLLPALLLLVCALSHSEPVKATHVAAENPAADSIGATGISASANTGNRSEVYVRRLAEIRILFVPQSGTQNPWAITSCNVRLRGPLASRHGNISLPLFFDGRGPASTAATSRGRSSNSSSTLGGSSDDAQVIIQQQVWTFAFRFTPDVPGAWDWSLINTEECPLSSAADADVAPKLLSVAAAAAAAAAADAPHITTTTIATTTNTTTTTTATTATTTTASSGRVNVIDGPGAGRGGVIVRRDDPTRMAREDGSRYTPIGYEMDWLWALGMQQDEPNSNATSIAPVEAALDTLAQYGFNHILVCLYANHSDWNGNLPRSPAHPYWAAEARNTPWLDSATGERVQRHGGAPAYGADAELITSNSTPYMHLNLRFYRHWDAIMAAADARDMVIHLMMYVSNKHVAWPSRLSLADDVYWRHSLARYAAHPAVVLDAGKEAGGRGVGADYVRNRIRLMHSYNGHRRLVTAHSGLLWSNNCSGCNLTLVSTQTHSENHTSGDFYRGIRHAAQSNPGLPIFNAEFMYAAGAHRFCNGSAGHDCAAATDATVDACGNDPSKIEPGHCRDLATMRRAFWSQYVALGATTWYDCDTAWDYISLPTTLDATSSALPTPAARTPPPPPPPPSPPGYKWMRHLSHFFSSVDRVHMQTCGPGVAVPVNTSVTVHCARDALQHDRALVYLWHQTQLHFYGSGNALNAMWFDPLTGASSNETVSGSATLSPPQTFAADAVLYLEPARSV